MIRLTIAQRGLPAADITDRIDFESDPVADLQRERTAFKRAYGDLSVRLNNIDGYFSRLLLSKHPSTWWEIELYCDGERKFLGRLTPPTEFDIKSDWITLTCFSIDKLFWERCASTTINLYPKTGSALIRYAQTMTVQNMLQMVLVADKMPLTALGISGIDIDSMYASKLIYLAVNDRRLKDKTTVEQLLQATAMYYNAEFFIDPSDGRCKMKQRLAVLNDKRTNIDDLLQDDGGITLKDTDDEGYDYIHFTRPLDRPAAPSLGAITPVSGAIDPYQNVQYVATYLLSFDGGITEVESEPSDPSSVATVQAAASSVVVNLPAVSSTVTVTGRVLYRIYGAEYRKVTEIRNNSTATYTDTLSMGFLSVSDKLVTQTRALHIWMRYDEPSGVWTAPVYSVDSGDAPEGKIFDITPKLEFIDSDGNNSTSDMTDVFAFFGSETDLQVYIDRWQSLFVTHRLIATSLYTKNISLGDSLVSLKGIFPNDFTADARMVLRSAKIHLAGEYTEAVIYTI